MSDKRSLEKDFDQLLENIPFDKYGIQAKSNDADNQLSEDAEQFKDASKEAYDSARDVAKEAADKTYDESRDFAADAAEEASHFFDSAHQRLGLQFEKFANKLGDDARDFADDAAEKISKNVENAYDDVKDFVKSNTDSISEKASDHGLTDRMHEQLEDAKDTMSSLSKSIGNEANDAYESSSNWFKEAVDNFNNWLNGNRQESKSPDEAKSAGNKSNSNAPEAEQSDTDNAAANAIQLEDVIGHHSPDTLIKPHYISGVEAPQINEPNNITDHAISSEFII